MYSEFAMSPEATIRYVDGEQSLKVRKIATWDRATMPDPVMSASSGPKDYIKNQIWAVFDKNPAIDRIVMVRASGPPFLLLRGPESCWFDVTGKQIVLAK